MIIYNSQLFLMNLDKSSDLINRSDSCFFVRHTFPYINIYTWTQTHTQIYRHIRRPTLKKRTKLLRQVVFVQIYAHTNKNILIDIDIHTQILCVNIYLSMWIFWCVCVYVDHENQHEVKQKDSHRDRLTHTDGHTHRRIMKTSMKSMRKVALGVCVHKHSHTHIQVDGHTHTSRPAMKNKSKPIRKAVWGGYNS